MNQVLSNKDNKYIIINGTEHINDVYNKLESAHYDCLKANIRQLKAVVKDMLEENNVKYTNITVDIEDLYYAIKISMDVPVIDSCMIYHSVFYATNELTEKDINDVVEAYNLYNEMKIKENNGNVSKRKI